MTEDMPRQYTTDDVSRIIRRALKIDQSESISHTELLETATELGIAPGKIEEAIRLEASAMEEEKYRNEYMKRGRSAFKSRLWTFAILNSFLFILNWITPGAWWFQWVLLGTGIGLAFGFRNAYFPTEHRIKRSLRRKGRRKNSIHGPRHARIL